MGVEIPNLPAAGTVSSTDEVIIFQGGTTAAGFVSQLSSGLEPTIDHTKILNIGANSHADIDAHIANQANPHLVTKTQVGLSDVQNILNNYTATTNPTANDDNTQGYSIGSHWINTATNNAYIASDVSTGAAVWAYLTAGALGRFVVNAAGNSSITYDPYPSTATGTNGSCRFALIAPPDFVSVSSCKAYGIPGATNTGLDIDLFINFSAPGELYNAGSASNITSTYDVTISETVTLDFTALLSGIGANDQIGFKIAHNAIGQTIGYTSLIFEYFRV